MRAFDCYNFYLSQANLHADSFYETYRCPGFSYQARQGNRQNHQSEHHFCRRLIVTE